MNLRRLTTTKRSETANLLEGVYPLTTKRVAEKSLVFQLKADQVADSYDRGKNLISYASDSSSIEHASQHSASPDGQEASMLKRQFSNWETLRRKKEASDAGRDCS